MSDTPPAIDAITEADVRRDLFALAGDDMRGREAGTLDEMRASMWVAERAREAGLQPAGENGTWFQGWSLRRTPRDNPETIDIAKLTRVARWMYATGWIVGVAGDRPDLVPGFKLER